MAKKVIPIRDFYYRTLGYIEILDDGTKVARDFSRRVLGKYFPKTNLTKDFYGRILGHGDMTTMLFKPYEK